MDHEVFWNAVSDNDARFDGAFVFAVKTTGIFCRPSCKARLPKRENVLFFELIAEAEACGYRACLRCRPTLALEADPMIQKVVSVCRDIAEFPDVSLDEIASNAGVSQYHFQRKFKELIGVSPKKYAEAIKMERFKEEVRSGSDVTTAMYDAGFGSSRGLYEKADERLGMTPAIYRRGGEGMEINYTITDCELGKLLVARTPRGICSVTFGETDAELHEGLRSEFPRSSITAKIDGLGDAVRSIVEYLGGKRERIVLPLDLQATAFQLQVWEMLRKIPYGETRSYSEIAIELGDKKKVRAVARACATNRVAVVIPCHRVVASDGKLSGYKWGVERKQQLLEKEASGKRT